ncbi:nickel-dependent lactate racemase [Campylobacter sp. faydin G-105]|uniref:nickel-dependent lactate racemase n=1 Tax=Campylobacter anatolicus TaxID=2829105 RepID=UPI001B9E31D3|nr:nickel-dependent lactate racemase [Campylobacter anatolicus]MBR8461866.1 nickel-dependent lactate racemase [Campylobacter anatolicus]
MQIGIAYGKDEVLNINVDEKNLLGIFDPNKVKKQDETELIKNALANPLNQAQFDKFIDTDEKIVIIVNDGTRPTPTSKVLAQIYPKLRNKDKTFIIANGCHRDPTEDEYHMIFSREIYEEIAPKGEIHSHDSKNDEMTYLGESKNGTPMYLNKIVAEAKKVIVIGSVEPHYFAGYTGGRKAFLPGTAKYETIEQNHKLALSPDAQALRLDGNPVHEDMIDAMKVLADIDVFAIMTVLDSEHSVYYASTGHLQDSFYDCIKKADEVFCVNIPKKADIVISVAPYPMDVDLYQAQKALDNGKLALAKDGVLIMVAKCRTGIGPKPFFNLMASADTPQKVLEKIKDEFHLGYHKAAKMAEISLWAKTWAVTDLSDDEMKAVHLKPYHDLQIALDDALADRGADASIIILPFGSMTVPKV